MGVAEKTEKKAGGLGETISVIVQALVLALIIRTFLFQPFSIPSGSMRPTLLEGDYLFVTKWAYGYSRYSFPFSPPIFSGRVPGQPAQARRRRGVQVSAQPLDRLHQACRRPARRHHPDEERPALHQRQPGAAQEGRPDRQSRHYRGRPPGRRLPGDAADGASYDTLDLSPDSIGDDTRASSRCRRDTIS